MALLDETPTRRSGRHFGHCRRLVAWRAYGLAVNEGHLFCDSDEWRAIVRDTMIPWAVGQVDLGENVLEIGPGYGATTDVFAARVPRLTSVEIDTELAMRLAERFAGTNVEVIVGDATALEFDDGRFSGVVCFSMLHHVPSPEMQDRIFAQAARVLRPGAPFVALDSVWSSDLEAFHEGDTYQPIDPDNLPERLAAAGFAEVEVRVDSLGWTALAHTPLKGGLAQQP